MSFPPAAAVAERRRGGGSRRRPPARGRLPGLPALVRARGLAAPRLEELRGPFGTEAVGWAARPATFDGAVALMRERGEVVTRAGARGWGLVGLP
ncbi:hypothetical protein [Streptomyces sp. NPDC002587]